MDIHEELVQECSREVIDRDNVTGLIRAISRPFVHACASGFSEDLDPFEVTFEFCGNRISTLLDENLSGDPDHAYLVGRFDSLIDALDMAYDRSISRAEVEKIADREIERRVFEQLPEDRDILVEELAGMLAMPVSELLPHLHSMNSRMHIRLFGPGRRIYVLWGPKGRATYLAALKKLQEAGEKKSI